MMYETSKKKKKSLVIIDFFVVNNDLVIADIFQSNDPRRDEGAN